MKKAQHQIIRNNYYFLRKLFILIFILTGCLSGNEVMYYATHTEIPGTKTEMRTPGFWISRVTEPDLTAADSNGIEMLNKEIMSSPVYVTDIFRIEETINTEALAKSLHNNVNYLRKKKLFFTNGKPADKKFFDDIEKNSNLNKVENTVKYCIFTSNADLRIVPLAVQLTDVKKELFFDAVQASRIGIGTAGVIIHKSECGNWAYTATANVAGWTEIKNLGITTKEDLTALVNRKFIVVTSGKADIFRDENLHKYTAAVRMGTRLLIKPDSEYSISYKIDLPARDEEGNLYFIDAFTAKENVSKGFLDLTPRNAINLSFKQLNAPYGWGGMFGEQDCSQYLAEIFSCFGVVLPRNSSNQSIIGEKIIEMKRDLPDEEKKRLIMEYGIPGLTFLRLPGHIMLYLGEYNNDVYVIHATWGYNERINKKDVLRAVNKVAVTNLNPGIGTKKGSLLQRVNRMNNVRFLEVKENSED